jgi:hypothetical protein
MTSRRERRIHNLLLTVGRSIAFAVLHRNPVRFMSAGQQFPAISDRDAG